MAEQTHTLAVAGHFLEVKHHQGQSLDCGFIMCHPHPLFGGTMDNKVVTTLVRAAQQQDLNTLRFNFRGVGNSSGKHGNGDEKLGEVQDVLAVVRFALNDLGWQKVILAGFSFGAGMACLSVAQLESVELAKVAALIMVAPAVHHFDAPNQLPHEFESHIYMGDADEVVPFDEVEHWASLVSPQPHFNVFSDAGHFFHGRLVELKNTFITDLESLA